MSTHPAGHRGALVGIAALACLVASCHDVPTQPLADRATPPQASPLSPKTGRTSDAADSPASGSAEFTVSGPDPIDGQEAEIGFYPWTTIVTMDVHQWISITPRNPASPPGGLALGGRMIGNGGCSHQGEAYLLEFPVDGGYGFPFAGCALGDQAGLTAYSAILALNGTVKYGFSYDSSCPPPQSACSDYAGSSGVSVHRMDASMSFGVDPDSATPAAVPVGYPLVFRATLTPETLGPFSTPFELVGAGWTFTNEAGETTDLDCAWTNPDPRVCRKAFYESGSIKLEAIVNGVHMTGGPIAVHVVYPTLSLSASRDSVAAGDTVVLSATITGGDSTDITGYSFEPAPLAGGGGGDGGALLTSRTPAAAARKPSASGVGVRAAVGPPSSSRVGPAGRTAAARAVRTPGARMLDVGSSGGLPPCGPGVLQCWVVPPVTGTYTVSATVRRYTVTADAAVRVTGDESLEFLEYSGDVVISSRAPLPMGGAARSTGRSASMAAAAPSLSVRMQPSERIGISRNPVYSTKQFKVHVKDGIGRLVRNADVKLSLEAHEGTGGHEHIDKAFPKDPGVFGVATETDTVKTVNTGADGEGGIFPYRAPDPAGLVTIHGLRGKETVATLDVEVAMDGLVQIQESRLFHRVGADYQHSDRFWVSTGEMAKLRKVADSVLAYFKDEPMEPGNTRRLSINDASLPHGGQFDIFGGVVRPNGKPRLDWKAPHGDHRRGQGVDFRHSDKSEEQMDLIKAYWAFLGGQVWDESAGQNPAATGPHYHLKECPTCSR